MKMKRDGTQSFKIAFYATTYTLKKWNPHEGNNKQKANTNH
jgi:hypothetical protein